MHKPRSSLAIALQDYTGPRPGVALTIAAVALIAALIVGVVHVITLGRAGTVIEEGQRTIRTLHSYNAALEVWRQFGEGVPEEEMPPQQIRLRDSIALALGRNLRALQEDLSDPIDRDLVATVIAELPVGRGAGDAAGLSQAGRGAMIVLTARQDSALFRAASDYQQSQFLAAAVIILTVIAAGVLIIPMSWLYVRHKRGVPPGM
ncbi:MAG: hypothetical protein O7D29_08425 [Gemmatimonadetes bacterium]|nr:hypothetical protein [Gemmatimonadota bacterium]